MSTQPSLPSTQCVAFLAAPNPTPTVEHRTTHPVPSPSSLLPNQCLVKIKYSGVCHSDLSIANGAFPGKPKPDLIGGHEGVGEVVAIGEHTYKASIKVGETVGIRYVADTCGECELCRKGLEQHCAKMQATGYSVDGTFAQYAIAYIDNVVRIPSTLDPAAATSIMCAGLTVYKALKGSGAHVGDWIVIPGSGGGLGHLGVQYAVAMGLRVIAIDSGDSKEIAALAQGAEHFIDFKKSGNVIADVRALTTDGLGAHAALLAVGSAGAYSQALMYLRPAGTLMAVGLPPGNLEAMFLLFVTRGITIKGSFVGNRQDAFEAVNIAASGKVKVNYEMRKLSELNQVYDDMNNDRIVGRIVLDVSQ